MAEQPYVDQWRLRFRKEVVPSIPTEVVCSDGRKRQRAAVVGVARACADLADFHDGRLNASVNTIAEAAGCGRKVVMPILDYLAVAGIIVEERRHGRRVATRRRLVIGGEQADMTVRAVGIVIDAATASVTVPPAGPSSGVDDPATAFDGPFKADDGPSRGDSSTHHKTTPRLSLVERRGCPGSRGS